MEYLYYGEQAQQQQVEKEERRPTLLFTGAEEKMHYYNHCISSVLMESYDEKFKNRIASMEELPSEEKIAEMKTVMKFLCVCQQVRLYEKSGQKLQLGLAKKLHQQLEREMKESREKRVANQKHMKAYYDEMKRQGKPFISSNKNKNTNNNNKNTNSNSHYFVCSISVAAAAVFLSVMIYKFM